MTAPALSEHALACLRLYGPSTYGIALGDEAAGELKAAGLVQWVPSPAWSGLTFALTEAGASFLADLRTPDPTSLSASGALNVER